MRLKAKHMGLFGWAVIDEEVVAIIENLRKRRSYAYDQPSAVVASGLIASSKRKNFIRSWKRIMPKRVWSRMRGDDENTKPHDEANAAIRARTNQRHRRASPPQSH